MPQSIRQVYNPTWKQATWRRLFLGFQHRAWFRMLRLLHVFKCCPHHSPGRGRARVDSLSGGTLLSLHDQVLVPSRSCFDTWKVFRNSQSVCEIKRSESHCASFAKNLRCCQRSYWDSVSWHWHQSGTTWGPTACSSMPQESWESQMHAMKNESYVKSRSSHVTKSIINLLRVFCSNSGTDSIYWWSTSMMIVCTCDPLLSPQPWPGHYPSNIRPREVWRGLSAHPQWPSFSPVMRSD